jgi:hypothetical protein
LSHGTCSHICMYISAVAHSVMLYLRHDFYNIIFKLKHKLYIVSGSSPRQRKLLGAHLCCYVTGNVSPRRIIEAQPCTTRFHTFKYLFYVSPPQTLQSVVDLGFRHNLPPFPTVSYHCQPVILLCLKPALIFIWRMPLCYRIHLNRFYENPSSHSCQYEYYLTVVP